MSNKKNYIIAAVVASLLVVIIGALTLPLISWLTQPTFQAEFSEWVNSLGVFGILVVLGIQILQVVVAVIPGEPIEIVAGMMYGTVGGLALCLVGITLSSALIFSLVRRVGSPFVERFYKQEEMSKFDFLFDATKLKSIIFILFFIPGTPKDILTYICPLTTISLKEFLLISTVARIPSVITSTYGGANLSNGEFHVALITFILTGALGLAGIYYNKKFMSKQQTKNS